MKASDLRRAEPGERFRVVARLAADDGLIGGYGHHFPIDAVVTFVRPMSSSTGSFVFDGPSMSNGETIRQYLDAAEVEPLHPPLTVTQHSALGDLQRFGRLVVPDVGQNVERGTERGFSRRTLQALVDRGYARWISAWVILPL